MRRLLEPHRSLAASSLAALLGAVLLLGTIEVHGTADEHSVLDQPSVVFTDAQHASQPAHLETSAVRHVPRCAWCVLHLQSLGGVPSLPASLVRPESARPLAGEILERPAHSPRGRAASRAPPRS
jgi:hypothetical protein